MKIISIALACFALGQFAYPQKPNKNQTAGAREWNKIISELHAAYAAFNRGDFNAAVARLDPDIEWSEPLEFPGGGTYHGRDAVKGYLMQSRARWAEGSSKPERFITAGDWIVVFVCARYRRKAATNGNESGWLMSTQYVRAGSCK